MELLVQWGEESPPFGHYWFMIDEVRVESDSVEWKVKVVR